MEKFLQSAERLVSPRTARASTSKRKADSDLEEGNAQSDEEGEMMPLRSGSSKVRKRYHGISFDGNRERIMSLLMAPDNYDKGVRTVGTMSEVRTFLIQLCLALHNYGCPAYRLEYDMGMACQHFGIDATFAALRTMLIICFGPHKDQQSQTHVLHAEQAFDCERLYLADNLCHRLHRHEVSFTEAKLELEEIMKKKPRFHPALKVLANGFAGAAIAPLFFHSGWSGCIVSFVLGLLVGLMLFLATKSPPFGRIVEFVAGAVVAFLARFINDFIYQTCIPAVEISAVVWLLPGLGLTIAMIELATRNLLSGTARFFFGLVVTFELGMGIAIGSKLAFWKESPEACEDISDWFHLLWVPMFMISANILLNGHPRHWVPMAVSAMIAFATSFFANKFGEFGYEASSALSALALALFSNIYYRVTKEPAVIFLLAGILLLVPGIIGLKGARALIGGRDIVSGIEFTMQLVAISLSITLGVFIGNALAYPQPSLIYKVVLADDTGKDGKAPKVIEKSYTQEQPDNNNNNDNNTQKKEQV